MGVIWHALCLYFTVLGYPGTILGRSWNDLGTLGSTRKDTVRSRLGFYRFLVVVDLGDPFREISGYIWTEKHAFFISISRLFFLMIFRFESGCMGLKNQAFCKGSITEINFAEIGCLTIPIFHDLGWPWDQFPWFLLPWRLAWNFVTFQGDSGVITDPDTEPVLG